MTPVIEAADAGFSSVVSPDARVEKIASGFGFTEGPVFNRNGYLLFSDIPSNRILKWTRAGLSTFRENSNGANGLTFDHQGRLLACEKGRVTRTEKNGSITVLAERCDGAPLKAPNDLVYAIDGSVYFSDPPWVYQITRRGDVRVAAREPKFANGVALNPTQLVLYVADTAAKSVWAYDIAGDGGLSNGRIAARTEFGPDGLKTDEEGNLYVAGGGGIWVVSVSGKHLGRIAVPEEPSNCAWGPGFRGLYITALTSVYYVQTKIPGTRTY